jgi:hypothetical protein
MPVTVAAMREEQEKGTWDGIETTDILVGG